MVFSENDSPVKLSKIGQQLGNNWLQSSNDRSAESLAAIGLQPTIHKKQNNRKLSPKKRAKFGEVSGNYWGTIGDILRAF